MNQKQGFGILPLIVILTIAVALAAGGYVVLKQKLVHPPTFLITNPSRTVLDEKLATPPAPPASTPTATSTDEMAGWKTYRNEKYGFEFKYPPYIFVVGQKDTGIILTQSDPNQNGADSANLNIVIGPLGNLKSLYEQTKPEDIIQTEIGGRSATKFDPYITFAGGEVFAVPLGRDALYISDIADSFKSSGLLDRILSTFKFTK